MQQGERHVDACVEGTDGNVGASVIVWAGFHCGGKSELVVLDGIMNQQVYRHVLQQSLLSWARATVHNNFVLVKDNILPHPARATRDFLVTLSNGNIFRVTGFL